MSSPGVRPLTRVYTILNQNFAPLAYAGFVQVLENLEILQDWKVLARVVQKVDNAIHRINHYPADSVVCFVNIYPLDSDLSVG